MTARIQRAACIGGGVIGRGWAARFALNGVHVSIFDPDPETARKAGEVLDNAERAFDRLFGDARPARGTLRVATGIAEAIDGAEFIQESVPERLDLKRMVLAEIDAAAPPEAVIASSTSGLRPSDMQRDLAHPGRMLVGHPFNPVYLLPLVEIVGGQATDAAAVERADAVYQSIGMKPVVVRQEIDAFIGDRLQEALWREALWLVHDGVATVEEIDDVIRYSFGLRWAQMGVFQVYRVAGGEAGMRHFMEQFGPCLKWPWTKLTDVPDLDEALVDRIAAQSDAQAAGLSIRALERIRDDNLIGIMEALERTGDAGWGAGARLREARDAMRERTQRQRTTGRRMDGRD
ncbi:MAG: 3-hydroxyacyl-CoA dehydrogenase NAD-binding domain-containing protein [Thiotrichales bacterium]|nr:3-hydroxyacyl-CoA dehydrogenase NAD-binding domain-containing protein [Thiotrichales bacterium]